MEAKITELKKKVLNNPHAKTTVEDLTMVLQDALGMLECANQRIEALDNANFEMAQNIKDDKKCIREALQEKSKVARTFDEIFTKTRPHILEKISLSLDYETFKSCQEVNKA